MRDQETHTHIYRESEKKKGGKSTQTYREGRREKEHTLMERYGC